VKPAGDLYADLGPFETGLIALLLHQYPEQV
jgi:hypothetical protein